MQSNHFPVAGDTPLHLLVRQCDSYENFIIHFDSLLLYERIDYSITQNNKGELPLDIINPSLADSEKKLIFKHLLSHALSRNTKSLYEMVDFEKYVKQFDLQQGSDLYHEVEVACQIMNDVRLFIKSKISTSHPDMNGMHMKMMRNLYELHPISKERWKAKFNRRLIKYGLFFMDEMTENQLEIIVSRFSFPRLYEAYRHVYEGNIFNCGEQAIIACEFGFKRNKHVISCIIQNGDHQVNALLKDGCIFRESDNLETISNIMFDTWSGEIILTKKHKTTLGVYKRFDFNNRIFNVVAKFNPEYNSIVLHSPYTPQDTWNIKNIFLGFKNDLLRFLLEPIVARVSPLDKYLFAVVIQENLYKCLKHELIGEEVVFSWKNPAYMLIQYFSYDDGYLPFVTHLYSRDENLYKKKILKALAKGADPDQSSVNGMTALLVSVKYGYVGIVRILLAAGANPDKCLGDLSINPLMEAVHNGNVEIAKLLLQAKANPDLIIYTKSGYSTNALFLAIKKNNESMIDLLLKYNADVNYAIANHLNYFYKHLFLSDVKPDRNRVVSHVYNKILSGENFDSISVTPLELAQMMGIRKLSGNYN